MEQKLENKILTIPNMLSAFRLCLIPFFIWQYSVEQDYIWAGIILVLSILSDILDGFIARTFHSISNLGKILDPVADKFTQAAVLFCLIGRFSFMLVPFVLLILKEIFVGITSILTIRKTRHVFGAKWHGKVSTSLLNAMMIVHVVWYDIPTTFSNFFIAICIAMMIVSLVLYGIQNIRALKAI